MTTSCPARASRRAVAAPAHRAPTITTSWWLRRVRPPDAWVKPVGTGFRSMYLAMKGSLDLFDAEQTPGARLRRSSVVCPTRRADPGHRCRWDGRRWTTSAPRAMHGRDEVLARAQRPLGEATEGRGGLVLLAGEAGIGKTRLLRAVQEHAGCAGIRAVVRRGLAPGRRALRRAAPGPRARDGAVGRSRRGRPREGAADGSRGRDRPVPALRRRAPAAPARGPGRGGPPGVAGRGGTDAPGARGPALVRRAEPGDRRAPGAAAALPAPAAWSARCAPTSSTRTPRPGPGGPGCCSSGSPWRLRLAPLDRDAVRADGPRPARAGAVRRAAWSSSCTSAPEGCRCTSRSSSTPPPRGT